MTREEIRMTLHRAVLLETKGNLIVELMYKLFQGKVVVIFSEMEERKNQQFHSVLEQLEEDRLRDKVAVNRTSGYIADLESNGRLIFKTSNCNPHSLRGIRADYYV